MSLRVPAFLAVGLCFSVLCGCSRPLLVVDESTRAAIVEFRNNSGGHLQQFYFGDPVNCQEPHLIDDSIKPFQSKTHRIPAEKVITIWTSAWRLPVKQGYVGVVQAACVLHGSRGGTALRNLLRRGPVQQSLWNAVLLEFRCPVKRIDREVSGPEIGGGGVLAGSFSCKPTEALRELSPRE
jgi:hypothetical protein